MPSPLPGGTVRSLSFASLSPALPLTAAAFPSRRWVGFRIKVFEPSGVHCCYGLPARRAAITALSVESFNRLVTSRLSRLLPGAMTISDGTFTAELQHPFHGARRESLMSLGPLHSPKQHSPQNLAMLGQRVSWFRVDIAAPAA